MIQPGSQITFDLNGIATAGHVTFTEGNKATVMYAVDGKSDFIVLDFELLKLKVIILYVNYIKSIKEFKKSN